ncbi:hypothetical protein AYO47_08505 [Planctomyces sp. SCGC AG-212-M04]|nr:hypothetical protein AYO47_08505 [Planctomyces sp. SCGC AG-212-M04]
MADASQTSPGRLAARQTVRTAMTGESALQQATRLMEHLKKQLEELDRREANLNRQLIAFDNERRGLKLLAQQLETQATHREQQLISREEEVLLSESSCDSRVRDLDAREQLLDQARAAIESERETLRMGMEEELAGQRGELLAVKEALDAREADLEIREAGLEQGIADLERRTRFHEEHLTRLRTEISAERAELGRDTAARRTWAIELEHVSALRLQQIRRLRGLLDRRETSLDAQAELLREQQESATAELARQREAVAREQEQLAQAIDDHARDVERHQEMLTLQAENLEGRRVRLDRLRDELDQERQENLESRLVVEQVFSQTVHAIEVPAAQERVQTARTKLFDYYRELREALTRRRQECEQAQRQLVERRDAFQTERDEQLQRVAEKEEQLAARNLELANQAEDYLIRESQFAAARERWRRDRLEAERVIRSLLTELECGAEASLEQTGSQMVQSAASRIVPLPPDDADLDSLRSEDNLDEAAPLAA